MYSDRKKSKERKEFNEEIKAIVKNVIPPYQESYVASVKQRKYHRLGCDAIKKIKSGNLVTFSHPSDAIAAGYSPCKVCILFHSMVRP
jgi:methylphosphotriester-DNA--protein-cysteine methyltransferase